MGNILSLSVIPAVTASDRINQNTDEASYKQVQRYKVDKQETWVVIHIHNIHTEMQNTVRVKGETNNIYTFWKKRYKTVCHWVGSLSKGTHLYSLLVNEMYLLACVPSMEVYTLFVLLQALTG